ncbi:hypothetical protein OROMI_016211 [Orobanche minor]
MDPKFVSLHAVIVVACGNIKDKEFIVVRNSYGEDWGYLNGLGNISPLAFLPLMYGVKELDWSVGPRDGAAPSFEEFWCFNVDGNDSNGNNGDTGNNSVGTSADWDWDWDDDFNW